MALCVGFCLQKMGFPLVDKEDEEKELFPSAPKKENKIDPTDVM
jgi:hypothetical protein